MIASPPSKPSRRRVPRGNFVAEVCFNYQIRRRAVWVLGLLSVLFVLMVGLFNAQEGMLPFDEPLTLATQQVRGGAWEALFKAVGFVGYSPWNAVVAALLCIGLGAWLGWQVGAFLAGLTLIQGVIGILLKFPITRARPMETDLNAPLAIIKESSFPSGHTSMYVVLFGLPTYLLWRHCAPRWLTWLATLLSAIMILLIGPARVSLGAHWWSDVVGAHLLGFWVLLLGIEFYERWLLPRLSLGDRWHIPIDE